ncbi:hypothetical protein BJP48_03760 [Paenibacillus odorifer]|nr:hypothetical protein BJP48_03760 [Paenibacillus odorifer]OME28286.1 hypothetical protein BSK57_00800 [Paenibacillus odorifer]
MTLYVTFEHIWLAIGHRTQMTLTVTFEHIWLATIAEAIGFYLPMQLIILHLTKKAATLPLQENRCFSSFIRLSFSSINHSETIVSF